MPLTTEQLQHLERRLVEERARVLESLDRTVADHSAATEREQSGDLTAMPFHPADLGTDAIDEEVDLSNASRESTELAEIDAALRRLRQTPALFGRCDDGEREIPFERLDLIPWAHGCD